jgi:1,4-alpha-glucan branching enzyme
VLVTGTFAGWSEENNRLTKEDGVWTFPIQLKPGKYLYKFKIDGEWIIDQKNPAFEENEFGTGNSVLWVNPDGFTP